ncbi:MAG: ATP-binding protein [Actinomycetota bacterium]|nr:ATP-binding protein [Actinomycetota bacterium]
MKSIVVASGKGGTGKTTMTAVFAHVASRRLAVAVADGDVEASNLPLALRAKDVSCTAFPGGARVVIDADVCVACGLCVQTCRFDAITEGISGAFVVDPFACEGCGRCAIVCGSGAVVMKPSTAGEACVGESAVGPIAFGQLGPGENLSGKLVTEVRRLGFQAAERHRADVLLIDGPPGIGCPLTAAIASTDMVVAVAEPTVSGAHDLDRLADVAARLGLAVRVVLNKADLSADGASRIRELCDSRDLPLVAEVPFDATLADAVRAFAAGAGSLVTDSSPGLRAVVGAWRAVESEVGL